MHVRRSVVLAHGLGPPAQDRGAAPCALPPDAVLSSRSNAPGCDNCPYELYHYGASFFVSLVFWTLETVLVDWPDLLAWIPKFDGASTTLGTRPLQLPTCLRRLVGSVLVDLTGAEMESRLSADQAAVRGGDCLRNVAAVYDDLAGRGTQAGADIPMWRGLFGRLAEPIGGAIHDASASDGCPEELAAVLADQSKAFERVAIWWLRRVLTRWGLGP